MATKIDFSRSSGCGLGKQEDGRSEPIKVSLKMDKAGVGHDPGKEFTDHWWLRVFNEAAQKIGRKQQVSKTNERSELKKQNKNVESNNKNNLYKNFVKSSTLTNGIEEKNGSSDSSSEDDSDNENNTSVPTLNDIHKFCGGATGHKAARFGIKMGGKLARVAEYDKMFEEGLEKEKFSQDVPTTDNSANSSLPHMVDQKSPTLSNDKQIACAIVCDKTKKKKHKKHKKDKCVQDEDGGCGFSEDLTDGPSGRVDDVVLETYSEKNKTKKHKKKKNNADSYGENDLPENKNSHKKMTKEDLSGSELHSEPRSKKKAKEYHNELLDQASSKWKKKEKTEENIASNDLLDEPRSKRKKKTEESVTNELLHEPVKVKKNKKTEENIRSNDILDESGSKRGKKAEESVQNNELLDEPVKRKKSKKSEQGICTNNSIGDNLGTPGETICSNGLLEESDCSSKKKRKKM